MARTIFKQLIKALKYINSKRIAHCDIKPENIFITRDAYDRRMVIVKLIDFGISRQFEGPREQRGRGPISGDPRYMAPEQTLRDAVIDHRTDLYSLGVTFYEAVAGRHPFEEFVDAGPRKLLEQHRAGDLMAPSHFLPQHTPAKLADEIDGFVARACAKRPDDRFSSADEMKAALDACLDVLEEIDRERSTGAPG